MTLDNETQRGVLLELIARAHKSPEEVAPVAALRTAIVQASVPEPEEPEPAV